MADDLISRSALIDELRTENQICITTTGHELTMNMVYSFINKQPTAYDVDKVVASIEEFYEEAEQYGFASAISDIVEVVRKGGVE